MRLREAPCGTPFVSVGQEESVVRNSDWEHAVIQEIRNKE